MSRQWTRRRLDPLNGVALDPEAFAQAYPLFRADSTDPTAASKEALGLLLTFVCLALPFHLAMRWLAASSLALTAGVGGAAAVGLLAVALARQLGQGELLRKLPLVLLIVLVAYGLHLLNTVQKGQVGWGGFEWVGLFLLITTIASVAASFYQPAAAAYRTVTQGTPVSTLVTAAAVTALSVGVAVLGQAIPRFVQAGVACVAVFAYAGLVLFEYAAWVKADPAIDLAAQLAQVAAATTDIERDQHTLPPRRGRQFLGEAVFIGVLVAMLFVLGDSLLSPASELSRLIISLDPEGANKLPELYLQGCLVAVAFLPIFIISASGDLNAARLPLGVPSLFLAWRPLAVFLTYPDTQHPLAHRLRFRWLRPKAVRLGLTAGLLLIVPSMNNRTATPTPPTVTGQTAPLVTTPPPAERRHPGDAELARILGISPEDLARSELPPAGSFPPATLAPTATGPSDSDQPPFLVVLFFAVIGPPAAVYAAVSALGVLILPAYRAIAKDAQSPTA